MTTKTKTTWRTVRLGDVADVQWGDTNTTKAAYRPTGYRTFSATGPDGYMDHFDFDREGVVLSAIGTTGETWYATGKWSCIKNTIRFWAKDNVADTRFLYYRTHNKRIWPTRGSTQPFIALGDARDVPVAIPEDICEQKRIAGVLAAFDEKIENNNRIIRTLEEMAQTIFKEWFVAPIASGEVPRGWEEKNVLEIVKRIPVGKKFENKTALPSGNVPILDQGQSGFIGYHNEEPGVMASIEHPVVVFTNHTCYYRLVTYPFSAIQNVLPYVGANGYPTLFAYYLTKDKIKMQEYKGHWPEFEQQVFVVPPVVLAERYAEDIKPMVEKIVETEKENIKLAAMRDLLLPRLMSGEIRV